MNQLAPSSAGSPSAPRSVGTLRLSTKRVAGRSGLDRFRSSGALKVAFPRRGDAVEAILVNTSGGLTGGDRFDIDAAAGEESRLVLTTQAAERAYRSAEGAARVDTQLSAGKGAALHWLPQELIVFDAAAIDRRLTVDLAPESEFVMVESIIFGRRAMGERVTSGNVRDTITIRRAGEPIYCDRIHLTGPIETHLDRPAAASGMSVLATALLIAPRAETVLSIVRALLPETGGASLLRPDLLCIRVLAEDSFLLRDRLVPILETLTRSTLPKSWRL